MPVGERPLMVNVVSSFNGCAEFIFGPVVAVVVLLIAVAFVVMKLLALIEFMEAEVELNKGAVALPPSFFANKQQKTEILVISKIE